ncbi:MAG: MOSC domain-containing protein [Actinomycetota bacterium]
MTSDGAATRRNGHEERVLSVNVGGIREVSHNGSPVPTGIYKHPVDGPVAVDATGLAGDEQADLSVHGGADKAVYLYSHEDYLYWAQELGRALAPGELGENLTVTGLTCDVVRIGDRLRVGGALLEVSVPREPCFKLGIRMGDKRFVARFRESGRTGFYTRVVEPGAVQVGDAVSLVETDPASPTVRDVHDAYVGGRDDAALMLRMAAVPRLATGWQEWMARRAEEAAQAG